MTSAEDRRLAAQRRAEELVARIKSDKAAREMTPTRDTPTTTGGSSQPAASSGVGLTLGGGGARPATGVPPDNRNHLSVTPERTPQMKTPGRDAASSLRAAAATTTTATPPEPMAPALMRSVSPPRSSVSATRSASPPPVMASVSATRSESPPPVITEERTSAIGMANAAIESARRAATDSILPPRAVGVPASVTTPSRRQPSPLPGTAEFVQYPAPGLSPGISSSQSFGSKGPMANLDLRNNDDAFHVLANIVTDRLLPKVPPGITSYTLDSSDRAFLDQMLPVSMRWSFVDALRFRRQQLPADSAPQESAVAALTRKCCWLGLDRSEEENALLQPGVTTVQVGLFSSAPQGYQPPSIRDSGSVEQQMSIDEALHERSIREQQVRLQEQQHNFQKQHLEMQQQQIYKQQLEIQQGQIQTQQNQIHHQLLGSSSPEAAPNSLHEVPLQASEGLDASFATDSSAENRARQQVMAELKEATALLTSSVTPEAAKFWKAHVVDLQARLRALNGEPPEPVPTDSRPTDDYRLADASGTFDSAGRESVGTGSREKIASHCRNRIMREGEGSEGGVVDAQVKHPVVSNASVVDHKKPLSKPPVRDEAKGYNGPPMVDVVAPADLPAGYTFEAQIGSKRFLATVPPGGVVRGDRFSCAIKNLDRVEIQVPTGHWRDELFDCFKFGSFHPLVLNTVFVPLLSVGQVMTRNQLNWLGERGTKLQSKTVFMNMTMVILFWASMNGMAIFHLAVNVNRGNLPTFVDYTALCVVNICMIVFSTYVVANTRASIRAKYGITDDSCGGKEDAVCAMFCMPCTIAQMGRHTADFETYRAVCCSDTGLPPNVELVPAPPAERNYPQLHDSHMV